MKNEYTNQGFIKDFKNKIKIIDKIGLPKDSYSIFGSGPMAIRGLREGRDVDIIVKPELWEILIKKYSKKYENRIDLDHLEIYKNWLPWFNDANELIEESDIIEGYKFVKLQNVLTWKESFNRPKDKVDSEIIKEYLRQISKYALKKLNMEVEEEFLKLKDFINDIDEKISRNIFSEFPIYLLKAIKGINLKDYHSVVCIVSGGLRYVPIFRRYGWKINYILAKKQIYYTIDINKVSLNIDLDKKINEISNKKILILDKNIYSGITSNKVFFELKKYFNIEGADLFIDYFYPESPYEKLEKKDILFKNIIIGKNTQIKKNEEEMLIREFIS